MKKKKNSPELQKPNIEAKVYNNNKKVTEKRKENRKSPKAQLDFIVPIKLTTTADGGEGKKEEKKENL